MARPSGKYVPCAFAEIPKAVVFTTPGPEQGQTIDVAYGHIGRWEGSYGDPWMRETDRSVGPTPKYFRWVPAAEATT